MEADGVQKKEVAQGDAGGAGDAVVRWGVAMVARVEHGCVCDIKHRPGHELYDMGSRRRGRRPTSEESIHHQYTVETSMAISDILHGMTTHPEDADRRASRGLGSECEWDGR